MENDNFQTLESVLVQINPREVVLPQNDSPVFKKVWQILCALRFHLRQSKAFSIFRFYN